MWYGTYCTAQKQCKVGKSTRKQDANRSSYTYIAINVSRSHAWRSTHVPLNNCLSAHKAVFGLAFVLCRRHGKKGEVRELLWFTSWRNNQWECGFKRCGRVTDIENLLPYLLALSCDIQCCGQCCISGSGSVKIRIIFPDPGSVPGCFRIRIHKQPKCAQQNSLEGKI